MSNIVITGCSSGFGLLSAITFAQHGHRVYATMRDPGKADALRAAADAAGVSVEVVALDVCSTPSVNEAIAQIAAKGPIDVLVNNAGIELFGSVHLLSDDEMLRQLDTNVIGLVRVCRAVVPHMLPNGGDGGPVARRGGTIVNVGSVAGLVGTPYGGMYAASKHAVEALSEAMHFELSQRGIRIRVVEPGQFATGLGTNSMTAAAMSPGTDDFERIAGDFSVNLRAVLQRYRLGVIHEFLSEKKLQHGVSQNGRTPDPADFDVQDFAAGLNVRGHLHATLFKQLHVGHAADGNAALAHRRSHRHSGGTREIDEDRVLRRSRQLNIAEPPDQDATDDGSRQHDDADAEF